MISDQKKLNTPIRVEGLPDWINAGQLNDLMELCPTLPSPFESAVLKSDKTIGKAAWQLIRLASLIILCLLGVRFFIQWKSSQGVQSAQSLFESEKERTRNNISSFVGAGESTYTYYAMGGIKNLSISVTNNSGYMLEHVGKTELY